ncbi:MAG TPA: hypothetical protein ENH84_04440, partial [Phycisphaerae bacterium]|nr:hypothetical protein [Phycisphaerae bacterium]
MNACVLISELLLPMSRTLTGPERWEAMQGAWLLGGGASWAGTMVALLVLVGGVVLGAVLGYGYIRRRKESEAFIDQGSHAGLGENDLKLLRYMVGLMNLKDPATIYTAEGLFNQAATRLMRDHRTIAMSPAMQAELNAQVQSMREKLGFRARLLSEESGENLISSRQIAIGSKIFITPQKYSEAVKGTIVETGDSEFVIEADEALSCRSGDDCVIRYSIGASAWEFETQIVRCEQKKVTFNHTYRSRLINRRKFPRVSVDRLAHIARFPLFSDDMQQETPEFIPTRLRQIGGPGLLLQASLRGRVGEKILVATRLATNQLVQGVGRIRRQ